MISSEISKNLKFPFHIRRAFGTVPEFKIKKIFPKIGLKNFTQKVKITNDSRYIKRELSTFLKVIEDFYPRYTESGGDPNLDLALSILHMLDENISMTSNLLLNDVEVLSITLFKKGENALVYLKNASKNIDKSLKGIIRYVHRCVEANDYDYDDEDIEFKFKSFTDFLNMFKEQEFTLNFSSDNKKGLWDIATMSMRGVTSCMRWSHINSSSLIGSMSDPCVGIIYIARNTSNDYGKIIEARSVVRLVTDRNEDPYLLIEPLYSNLPSSFNDKINKLFFKALKDKVKLNVIFPNRDSEYVNSTGLCMPLVHGAPSVVSRGDYHTYSDSDLPYSSYHHHFDDLVSSVNFKKVNNPRLIKENS